MPGARRGRIIRHISTIVGGMAGTSRSAVELPAVLDNRAGRRGEDRDPTAIAGAPFFTTQTARIAGP